MTMARYEAQEVFDKIEGTRLLPLFNVADVEVCKRVIRCCHDAGLRAFELTNRDPQALDIFRQLVPFVAEELPDLTLGAGTILDGHTAELYIEAGADFIIAPTMDPETGAVCRERNIPWIPGTMTPTEIHHAYKLGAQVVKIFPAGMLGVDFLKQVLAPLPFVKAIATGGVKLDGPSLVSWRDAGVFAVGLGSQLFNHDLLKRHDYPAIVEKIRHLRTFMA
jgi:2-dehydro-3-deoxyphosphogluconate aldolase / (4S)-4-hydroxy-2-oxoglutarate aldolase